MIKIRNNTFETNSSSTHSMVIGPKSQIEEWMKGKLVYDYDNDKFISLEAAHEIFLKKLSEQEREYFTLSFEEKEAFLEERYPWWTVEDYESELYRESYLFTYDRYCDYYEYLETDTNYYTTPGGEEIGIICSYGRDD